MLILQKFRCPNCRYFYRVLSEVYTDKQKEVLETQEVSCPRCNTRMDLTTEEVSDIFSSTEDGENIRVYLFGDEIVDISPEEIKVNIENLILNGFNGLISISNIAEDIVNLEVLPDSQSYVFFKKKNKKKLGE